MQLRMIAGGGGGGLTVEQPENNIVRGAYYALISALSGTQTMALCSYDEAYTIPSEHAAKISLRTMQILMHEMGLCDTADPLGGSWFVESTTNLMEQKIVEIVDRIDAEGGIVKSVAEGRIQAEVSRQAYEHEKKVQRGEIKKVGVNIYREDEAEERPVELHPYRAEEAAKQIARLSKVRAERDPAAVAAMLGGVRAAATGGQNVMPAVIAAVKVYATVGEVCGVLRDVFGTYREPTRF